MPPTDITPQDILTRKQRIWFMAHMIMKRLLDMDRVDLVCQIAEDGEGKFIEHYRTRERRAFLLSDRPDAEGIPIVAAEDRFTNAELGEMFEHIVFWVAEVGRRGQAARAAQGGR